MQDEPADTPVDAMVALDPAALDGTVRDTAAALVTAATAATGGAAAVGRVFEHACAFAVRANPRVLANLQASPTVRSVLPEGADVAIRPIGVRPVSS